MATPRPRELAVPCRAGRGIEKLECAAPQQIAVLPRRPERDGRRGQGGVVQGMDAFGRRGGEHVSQVLAQELVDIPAQRVVPVNGNHRTPIYRAALPTPQTPPCDSEGLDTADLRIYRAKVAAA